MHMAETMRGKLPERGGITALMKLRVRLEAEGYRVTLQLLAPGTSFAAHCPCESRIDAVFCGQLRVVSAGRERMLGPGDWMEVPAGVMMSAEVVGDSPVLGLDATRD